jgi:glucosamine--fructose-6-phosphate aminotransferase (isomerizing)
MSLHDEMLEQPTVLAGLVRSSLEATTDAATILSRPDVVHAVIAARGTSDNAARYAKYVWGSLAGLSVTLAAPSLYGGYGTPPDLAGSAVVGISQSGQSPDLIAVVEEGRSQGRPTIAITNDPTSPLAAMADAVVPLAAGSERAVAATKTYTATLFAVAAIAAAMHPGLDRSEELAALPDAVAETLTAEAEIRAAAARFGPVRDCVVLGRGFNYATAFEWALKLQEMAYVLAHPFSTADFAHGPFAVLERHFPVLAVAMQGPMYGVTVEMLERMWRERAANLITITDDHELAGDSIVVPKVAEWLTPIPAIVAAQMFTLAMAELRGVDSENPRGLQKVTRTE